MRHREWEPTIGFSSQVKRSNEQTDNIAEAILRALPLPPAEDESETIQTEIMKATTRRRKPLTERADAVLRLSRPRQISGEIYRQTGRHVFPLYHSVMAPPWGRAVLVAFGEGGALPKGEFLRRRAFTSVMHRSSGAKRCPTAPSVARESCRPCRGRLRSEGVASTDSSHQAIPRIQPSISATLP
jgi:hypothetical protein